MRKEFVDLITRIDEISEEMRPLLPQLAAARNGYMRDPSSKNSELLEEVQTRVSALHEESKKLTEQLPAASGLPLELFESPAISDGENSSSRPDHLPRKNLTVDRIETTLNIDDSLAAAVEHVERLLPRGWLEEEAASATRISAMMAPEAFLSITKGVRIESERSQVHRLRQAINVCNDYLAAHPLYDHFAGAQLVPSIVQLFRQSGNLANVGGERDERLRQLWAGPSAQVDSTLFELLVAAACAEKGRDIEFLHATSVKSADMRCHDPYPLVIECKRQDAISDYEADEEAIMRRVFGSLREGARRKGMSGIFNLSLSVEAADIDVEEVVARLIMQRLAPRPERSLVYPWGEVAFTELDRRCPLPSSTRIYSPNMLEFLFGWNTDLPDWDGICCSIRCGNEATIETAREPIGLLWKNISTNALRKRTWAPTNLFGQATHQIPWGEFGIVYVAYMEGARAELADLRLSAFRTRLQEWEHSSKIRIPISFLCRLYPRALNEGQPDLIESGVQYWSGAYGDPVLFERFPTTIFTAAGDSN